MSKAPAEHCSDSRIYDVAIVGGGVIGLMLARELSRYQLDVLLLEKEDDVAMGQTKANSAILHGGYAESSHTLRGRLCYAGRVQYPKLDAELHFGYRQTGSLVIAFDPDDLSTLEHLKENGIANGLPAEELEIWDRPTLLERCPGLNPDVQAALYCSGAGILSPYVLAIALAENAVENGLELRLNAELCAVDHIQKAGEPVFRLSVRRPDAALKETPDEGEAVYTARRLVNAAGLGSAKVAELAGAEVPDLIGRSGEYILLDRGTDSLAPYVLFGMPTPLGKGILISPTVHGNLILGPDAENLEELNPEDAARIGRDTHLDRLLGIWDQANELHPDLPAARIIRDFAGVRAAARSGDFLIGPDPSGQVSGYYQAAGIQSPGLTAAPAIARMLIEQMQHDGLELIEEPQFQPERLPGFRPLNSAAVDTDTGREVLPPAELKPLLDLPLGTPGRMICRCEQVEEAAIRDNLRRGIPVTTVDAVKRRCRAGMGFCQGQFCRSRVSEVICDELGLDPEAYDSRTDAEKHSVSRVGGAAIRRGIKKPT